MITTKAQTILKYKDLTTEIQRKWNVKTNVIPETIWANGTIPKSFRKYLSNIRESTKSRNYRKQSYLLLHTHTSESANVKVLKLLSS